MPKIVKTTGTGVEISWTPSREKGVTRYIVAYGPANDPMRTRHVGDGAERGDCECARRHAHRGQGRERGWTRRLGLGADHRAVARRPGVTTSDGVRRSAAQSSTRAVAPAQCAKRRAPPRAGSSLARASSWLAQCSRLWWLSRAQPPTVTPAPATMSDPNQAERRPPRQPLELPALASSDDMLRESGRPAFARPAAGAPARDTRARRAT